ncbi:hypothetical protein [Bradyrhizobium sp. YR681]|uniref:hypothetical protein n=1 Tax=Bradyrhizobium sp. YR681 TaxID=1144344 RepID=UPI001F0B4F42|nr:hypothetical protein [Bradyrhizobium sp. YR681]
MLQRVILNTDLRQAVFQAPMAPQSKTMWFDPQLRAKSAELQETIRKLSDTLCEHESASGPRKRARKDSDRKKFAVAVEALACNVILLKAVAADTLLAVPRSHNFIWQGTGRTSPVFEQHFLTAIALLASLGLIIDKQRGYRISARLKVPSLIGPTARLAQHLPIAPPDWRNVYQIDDPALVVLKEGKDIEGRAAPIRYAETVQTKKFANQIRRINKFLRDADIEVIGQNPGLSLGKDGQIIAPYRRSLRRVFNNGTWMHGGRLAGGFWMSMERSQRENIRIDGERVADVDYRQLFPRLAYVRAGQPQPDGDIYDMFGDGTGRDGCKKLMNAMLFADNPLGNWPEDTRQHFPAGTKLRTAIEMLTARHAPIAKLFGTGLGFQLMRIESDMLIEVITYLASIGVTALPLHDAVLVAESKAEIAAKAMRDVFERWSGSPCAIVSVRFSSKQQ